MAHPFCLLLLLVHIRSLLHCAASPFTLFEHSTESMITESNQQFFTTESLTDSSSHKPSERFYSNTNSNVSKVSEIGTEYIKLESSSLNTAVFLSPLADLPSDHSIETFSTIQPQLDLIVPEMIVPMPVQSNLLPFTPALPTYPKEETDLSNSKLLDEENTAVTRSATVIQSQTETILNTISQSPESESPEQILQSEGIINIPTVEPVKAVPPSKSKKLFESNSEFHKVILSDNINQNELILSEPLYKSTISTIEQNEKIMYIDNVIGQNSTTMSAPELFVESSSLSSTNVSKLLLMDQKVIPTSLSTLVVTTFNHNNSSMHDNNNKNASNVSLQKSEADVTGGDGSSSNSSNNNTISFNILLTFILVALVISNINNVIIIM